MKIGFFKPNSLVVGGGAEKWTIEVSRRLHKTHKISIIGLKYAPIRRLDFNTLSSIRNLVDYYELPFIKPPRGVALPHPSSLGKFLSLLNSLDVVYFIIPSLPIEAVLYAMRKGIKSRLIGGFHGLVRKDVKLQGLYLPVFIRSLRVFKCFHTLNQHTMQWLKKLGYEKIYLIPNGVDVKRFKLCSQTNRFNVLWTGRLEEDKGADILIKILLLANRELEKKNVGFTIVGSGSYSSEVRKLAHKYANITYLGFVDERNLSRVYTNSNLFIIPSKTEGMPLCLLEAQACGLPVVGSKIPGITEVVIDGKTGSLINSGNVKDFVDAIKEYYELWHNSSKEWRKLNKAIRKHIVSNYDWSIVISRLEQMFRDLT